MNKENAEKLWANFDFLDPEERLMEFGFGCPDSWFNLLWNLCERIREELTQNEELKENFRVLQVKEKLGMLRFYVIGGNEKIRDMIADAMEKSEKIRR